MISDEIEQQPAIRVKSGVKIQVMDESVLLNQWCATVIGNFIVVSVFKLIPLLLIEIATMEAMRIRSIVVRLNLNFCSTD